LSVQENLIYVSIDMVNVVLDIKCIRLKYILETINYNKVHLLCSGLNFSQRRNYKINLFFHKKTLEFREVLFITGFIKYQHSIVK